MSSVKSALILLPFLTCTLHESNTRKALLGPWLKNTEGYLTPSLVLKFTQMQDNITSIHHTQGIISLYPHCTNNTDNSNVLYIQSNLHPTVTFVPKEKWQHKTSDCLFKISLSGLSVQVRKDLCITVTGT